jgi:sulfotransferase family protein
MNPIFIIGTERSGTNLLRLILNSHSSIAVPHPPHIMKLFGPIERLYGDLRDDRNFRRLIGDICRMVELHPYPWEIKPDRERVFRRAADRNLISVYFAIYDQYLAYSGKKRWACKSTFMIEHVPDILRYHPGARFIFMVRDGRDVAVSSKSSIFNHYHVFYTAQRWKREQRLGLSWLSRLPADQILLLKYEDLIREPLNAAKGICSFLGERFEGAMLEHHRTAEAKKSGSLCVSWENTSQPVISGNAEKFRKHLSKKEIRLFEAIAFNELGDLGYPLTHPRDSLAGMHDTMMKPAIHYRLSEIFLALRAQAKHLLRDRSSATRLKKMLYLGYVRMRRRMAV